MASPKISWNDKKLIIVVNGYQLFHKMVNSSIIMAKVIRDTGTLVLIKRTVAYQSRSYNPLDIQITYTSQNMVSQTFTKRTIWVFFTTLKICFRVQSQNTRVLTFQPFQLQLKNEHFLKVKVKCYSKKRMIPIEKYIYFT